MSLLAGTNSSLVMTDQLRRTCLSSNETYPQALFGQKWHKDSRGIE